MLISRIYLGIASLVFVGCGVAYLFFPMSIMSQMEFGALAPAALTDVRATYGGLQIGMGLFQLWCLLRTEHLKTGLLATLLMSSGIAGCRAIGLLIDGNPTPILVSALIFEALSAGLTLVIYWRCCSASGVERGRWTSDAIRGNSSL